MTLKSNLGMLYAALATASIAAAVGLKLWTPHTELAAALAYGLIIAALMGFAVIAWRGLDEAAREAHKAAWFWGGAAGLALAGWGASVLLAPSGAMFAAIMPEVNDPRGYFGLGVLATMLLQLAGFTVAWTAWWLSKR